MNLSRKAKNADMDSSNCLNWTKSLDAMCC